MNKNFAFACRSSIKFALTTILIFSFINLSAQFETQMAAIGDTVELHVSTPFMGTIQWQKSTDNSIWTDIPGATSDPSDVIVTASTSGYWFYRAEITDNLCPYNPTNTSFSTYIMVVPSVSDIQLGDWYLGGHLYYRDSSGNGFISTYYDQSDQIEFGCSGSYTLGAYSNTDGVANTAALITECTTSVAARYCDTTLENGYDDWYLPSIDELDTLSHNISNVGSYYNMWYWSSTEYNDYYAMAANFYQGIVGPTDKVVTLALRCIRSFPPAANYRIKRYVTIFTQWQTVYITAQPVSAVKCPGDSVTFSVSATGESISYQWKKNGMTIPGANSNSFTMHDLIQAQAGIFTCSVSNMCRTLVSNDAELKVIQITAEAGHDTVICNGQEVVLNAAGTSNHPASSGQISYTWTPSDDLSSVNIPNPETSADSTTLYTVMVTDELGCTAADSVLITVHNVFSDEQICLVTVDTTLWKNKIIWKRTQGAGTEYYLIYRETGTNYYQQLGHVAFSQSPEYIDILSMPEAHGDKYKITALDTCGNESDIDACYFHKTINMGIGANGSTMGLTWDYYEDEGGYFVPDMYYIYRGTNPWNMTLLDSVSGSFNSYNDINVFDVYYYMVSARRSDVCDTSLSNFKEAYSNKRDNRDYIESVGENSIYNGTIILSPNPATNLVNLSIPNFDFSDISDDDNVTIIDITGNTVLSVKILSLTNNSIYFAGGSIAALQISLNTDHLKPGIYMVELNSARKYRGKLVLKS